MSAISRPLVEAYWLGYVPSNDVKEPHGDALGLGQIATNAPVNVVKVAFYNLSPVSMPSVCFGMSQGHDWVYTQAGIESLQARGIKVLASIIGTPHPRVEWNDIPDPHAFAANVKGLFIDTLGCDGIDIDNESPGDPDETFEAVVTALREELGPKGSDKALLTYVTYQPDRDLPWLKKVGASFDWVSTMAYWLDTAGQKELWQEYATLLGPENVLVGVAAGNDSQSTDLRTVAEIAEWETQRGAGQTGGMMLWNMSSGEDTGRYYTTIRRYLKIWNPPAGG
jgi:chitinase